MKYNNKIDNFKMFVASVYELVDNNEENMDEGKMVETLSHKLQVKFQPIQKGIEWMINKRMIKRVNEDGYNFLVNKQYELKKILA